MSAKKLVAGDAFIFLRYAMFTCVYYLYVFGFWAVHNHIFSLILAEEKMGNFELVFEGS